MCNLCILGSIILRIIPWTGIDGYDCRRLHYHCSRSCACYVRFKLFTAGTGKHPFKSPADGCDQGADNTESKVLRSFRLVGCAIGMSLNVTYAFWGVLFCVLFLGQELTVTIVAPVQALHRWSLRTSLQVPSRSLRSGRR